MARPRGERERERERLESLRKRSVAFQSVPGSGVKHRCPTRHARLLFLAIPFCSLVAAPPPLTSAVLVSFHSATPRPAHAQGPEEITEWSNPVSFNKPLLVNGYHVQGSRPSSQLGMRLKWGVSTTHRAWSAHSAFRGQRKRQEASRALGVR